IRLRISKLRIRVRLQLRRLLWPSLATRRTTPLAALVLIALPHNFKITAAEWETFLDDLQQTLDKFAVPDPEQAAIKAESQGTRADLGVKGGALAPWPTCSMLSADKKISRTG